MVCLFWIVLCFFGGCIGGEVSSRHLELALIASSKHKKYGQAK